MVPGGWRQGRLRLKILELHSRMLVYTFHEEWQVVPHVALSPLALQLELAGKFGNKIRLRRDGANTSLLRSMCSEKINVPLELSRYDIKIDMRSLIAFASSAE